jgi:hypothetical protein
MNCHDRVCTCTRSVSQSSVVQTCCGNSISTNRTGDVRVVHDGDNDAYYMTAPEIDNPPETGRFDKPAEQLIGRINGLGPHDLRHTAASLAVAAGANVKAIQKMLGHASAAMTLDIYADLFDDDLEAVATALDEAHARESVGKMWARPRGPTR